MNLFTLCGGLAFFLYGMNTLSANLEHLAGGRLRRALRRVTASPLKGLALGMGVTAAIQSSSAMTVMLVGLVNAGVLEPRQTIGVIMGANIGTTLTAWLLALTGVKSGNLLVRLANPEAFAPVLALTGMLLILGSKRQRRRDMGRSFVGFAILMYGMELMRQAVAPLAELPQFRTLLTAFRNPLLGVLAGAVFTGVIQSSAASVGILQALALTGGITCGMAVPIVMGQNIGTCATALLSAVGAGKAAKQVAVIHVAFNLFGAAAGLLLFCGGDALFHFPFAQAPIGAAGVALCHTAFNVGATALLLPFSRQLERLAGFFCPV